MIKIRSRLHASQFGANNACNWLQRRDGFMHEADMMLIEFSPSLPATVRAAILRLNVRGVPAIIMTVSDVTCAHAHK